MQVYHTGFRCLGVRVWGSGFWDCWGMGVLALWVQLQARLSARQVIASRNSEILVRGIDLIRNGTFLPRPRIFLIPRVVSRGAGLRGRARPRVGVGKSSTARHFSFKHTDFLQNSTPLHFGSGRGLGVWAGTGRAEGGAKVQNALILEFSSREKLEMLAFELSQRPSRSSCLEEFNRAHFGVSRPRKARSARV